MSIRIPAPRKIVKPLRDNLALIARSLHNSVSSALVPTVVASTEVAVAVVEEVAPAPVEMAPSEEVAEVPETIASEEMVPEMIPEPIEAVDPEPIPAEEVEEPAEEAHVIVRETVEFVEIPGTPESPSDASWDASMKKADLLIVAASKGISLPPTATKTEILNALKGHTASA